MTGALLVVQLAREQIETIATEAPARAPAPGTPHGEAGPAAGSGRAEGEQSDAGGRRRSRSRRDSAGTAAAAGLAKDRVRPDPAARSTARPRTRRRPLSAPPRRILTDSVGRRVRCCQPSETRFIGRRSSRRSSWRARRHSPSPAPRTPPATGSALPSRRLRPQPDSVRQRSNVTFAGPRNCIQVTVNPRGRGAADELACA